MASTVTVKATVTDNVGVTDVRLMVDSMMVASKSAPPFVFHAALTPGSHTLKVLAFDKAQNKGQAVVNVTSGGAPSPGQDTGAAPKLDAGAAPTPGADGGSSFFGAACDRPEDCQSRLCATDPSFGASYCTQKCGVQGWCPPGATCTQSAGGGPSVCALQNTNQQGGGGCSLGGGSVAIGLWGLGLLWLLLLLRRAIRSRRRSGGAR